GVSDEGTTECYALQSGVALGEHLGLSSDAAGPLMRTQLAEGAQQKRSVRAGRPVDATAAREKPKPKRSCLRVPGPSRLPRRRSPRPRPGQPPVPVIERSCAKGLKSCVRRAD